MPSAQLGGPTRFAELEFIDDDSGEPVPLLDLSWYSSGQEQTMALHPVAPLASFVGASALLRRASRRS